MSPNAVVDRLDQKEECKGTDELGSHNRLVECVGVNGVRSIAKRIAH